MFWYYYKHNDSSLSQLLLVFSSLGLNPISGHGWLVVRNLTASREAWWSCAVSMPQTSSHPSLHMTKCVHMFGHFLTTGFISLCCSRILTGPSIFGLSLILKPHSEKEKNHKNKLAYILEYVQWLFCHWAIIQMQASPNLKAESPIFPHIVFVGMTVSGDHFSKYSLMFSLLLA